MNNWLESFAYGVGIEWWIFVLAGAGMIVVALITVTFQSIRAVFMNPVKSLRTE
jgi:putative ABC transport system permease protein